MILEMMTGIPYLLFMGNFSLSTEDFLFFLILFTYFNIFDIKVVHRLIYIIC